MLSKFLVAAAITVVFGTAAYIVLPPSISSAQATDMTKFDSQQVIDFCGKGKGVFDCYHKVAAQGNEAAETILCMGYTKGVDGDPGLNQSFDQAAVWCNKAAQHGNPVGQFSLGIFYRDGYGVKKDKDQAMFWLRKASQQKDYGIANDASTELEKMTRPKMSQSDIQRCETYANLQLRIWSVQSQFIGKDSAIQKLGEDIKRNRGQACLERVAKEWAK